MKGVDAMAATLKDNQYPTVWLAAASRSFETISYMGRCVLKASKAA